MASQPLLLAGEDLPPAPKQDRSKRAREALLAATLALFAERGFERTGIEDIASAAGVAVGGFYQHFRSKRQALLVLMDGLVKELGAIEFVLPAGVPPRILVGAIVHIGLGIDWSYSGAYRAWREVISQDEELAGLNRTLEAWTLGRLEEIAALLLTLPGARPDVDVDGFCWVANQLFLRLMETAAHDREAVERSVTTLFVHALFSD